MPQRYTCIFKRALPFLQEFIIPHPLRRAIPLPLSLFQQLWTIIFRLQINYSELWTIILQLQINCSEHRIMILHLQISYSELRIIILQLQIYCSELLMIILQLQIYCSEFGTDGSSYIIQCMQPPMTLQRGQEESRKAEKRTR